MSKKKLKIGVVGCGSIGAQLAKFIAVELKGQAQLKAICDVKPLAAKSLAVKLPAGVKILTLEKLFQSCDLIVETASQDAARQVLELGVKFKKDLFILSAGALIGAQALVKAARAAGIKIYLPSGAVCGIDGIAALALGKIKSISLVTSKPPAGLIGAAYLKEKGISLENLTEPKVVFRGTVSQAVKSFPQNINVAATILTASSFNDVSVSIVADPKLTRNVHCIILESKDASLKIEVANVPSVDNPKTSALAVLSAKSLLKKIFSSLIIGS